ncbi:M28 family peptidase [Fulvivirga sedimenti]|uniref:M28 family metallopeptidase n=1 Tax=Fulvivirga sedimenti TaxID=2879465 RepID=A0A9X1HWN7_9BACT|nr:M28 family peptidase [Fulvivirga sedimenti]MCA6079016.1 M28 family metallopeptidase [Fulvivirga sedimenti]
MKKIIPFIVAFGLVMTAHAQKDETAVKYAETITVEDLTDDLTILASDALEGRETGERGQKMAAAYIREHFKSLGLEAPVSIEGGRSFYQSVPLYTNVPGETFLTVGDKNYENFGDVVHIGSGGTKTNEGLEVIYGGDGSEEATADLKVAGKAVMIEAQGMRSWRASAERLKEEGAALLLILNAPSDEVFATMAVQLKGYLSGGRLSIDKPEDSSNDNLEVFFVSPSTAANILNLNLEQLPELKEGSIKKIKSKKIGYSVSSVLKTVESENVLGFLEGTDKKDEIIVLTAHFDHVGVNDGKVYNGADDDGSGTSAILEIAEAFVTAKNEGHGPRRSILFMTVTGEEKGLLGSGYYVANPVFPLANTVVDLNIDMIGRVDPEHKDNPNYVYVVGSDKLSTELHIISESTNSTYTQMDLDYTYNDQNHPDRIYYRSDHWNFAKNNIPVIFYFNGVHEDYHQASDTVDKINFEMLAKRAQLVFFTAWELANRDGRIKVDITPESGSN